MIYDKEILILFIESVNSTQYGRLKYFIKFFPTLLSTFLLAFKII